jgi:predicted NBD/HSP70 family sugar kinase
MQRKRVVTSEVRKINRNLIFQTLYEYPDQTKADLSHLLSLSLPTINQNLSELSAEDLVKSNGHQKSTGGRKAIEYRVNSNARYAIGLDITANHIATVILNLCGEMLYSRRTRKVFEPTQAYCKSIADHIELLLTDLMIPVDHILGVGLAVPAIVSKDARTLTYASLLNFTNGRLGDFEKALPYPCRFVNDATAGGIAEAWYNPTIKKGQAEQTIAYLSLNNSVGGAFLIGGSIYEGQNQRASEFGHITLHPGGRKCYCGQLGCVDAYLGAKLLSDLSDGNLPAFFEGVEMKTKAPLQSFDRYVDDLVLTINTLRMVYDCSVICGGYVGGYLTSHLPRIRQALSKVNTFESDGSYLFECAYKYEATAVGSALTYLDEFIQSI